MTPLPSSINIYLSLLTLITTKMGVFYETIPKSLIPWILDQKVIWIASAPLSNAGHVNVSPKGGSYFGVVDEKTFWYQDLTGSGVETISHLLEPNNGRITVLFNAFDGPPRIVRLWGHGRPLEYGSPAFLDFVAKHDVKTIPGTRAIVVVDIHQVGTSCGFSMPVYDFKEFRQTLNDFAVKKVANDEKGDVKNGMEAYWAFKNSESMDGLPGMRRGVETAKNNNVTPITKMVGAAALKTPRNVSNRLSSTSPVVIALLSFFAGLAVATFLFSFASGDMHGSLTDDINTLMREIKGGP